MRWSVGPLFLALGAQAFVLLMAVYVIVIGPIFESEPVFTAKKTIYLPQRELEHRMSVAAFEEATASPVMLNKLRTESLVSNDLSPLPSLPSVEYDSPLEHSMMDASVLLGQSGLLGGVGGIKTESSAIAFFGVKEAASKVVICVDVSSSVKRKVEQAGYSMRQIKEEAGRVIEGLNANTLLGFIQFSRKYDFFRNYLVPATQENKARVLAWLESEFRMDGSSAPSWRQDHPNGIQSVVKAAFALDPEPDLLIILSDGSFQRTGEKRRTENVPWAELAREIGNYQEVLPDPVRMLFIGFQMKKVDRSEMNKILRRYGGRLKEIQ